MLCHHFNCVFVHIPKAAGQSIEKVFLEKLGLTWETRDPLLLGENNNPLTCPRSFSHLTASEYVAKKFMTPEQFSKYFKFTFVRNPYSRLVSTYIYFDYINKYSFNEFLKEIVSKRIDDTNYLLDRHCLRQTQFSHDTNGNLLVDFVGRFESIQKDFDYVCSQIGMPQLKLPHTNKSINSVEPKSAISSAKLAIKNAHLWRRNLRLKEQFMDYYDQESINLTNSLYEADFKKFDYEMLK
jgi:hypothetical protein